MSDWDDLQAEAVDVDFETFGTAATYTPSVGPSIPDVLVNLDVREEGQEAGQSIPRLGQCSLEVRKSQVAAPARGERFVIASGRFAGTYEIMDRPRPRDADGSIWAMWVIKS